MNRQLRDPKDGQSAFTVLKDTFFPEAAYPPTACAPASCANGKCQATGECACPPWPKTDREWANLAVVEAAALPVGYTNVPINAGHGHVRARPDGVKARCGGPSLCIVCFREKTALLPAVEAPPLVPSFNCNCPHEVRSGCSEPACSHYVRPRAPTTGERLINAAREGRDIARGTRTIIAFTGLAGSGKSTAAHHLVNRRGFQRIRFAGPLKAMMAALGLTPEQIDGREKEVPCALLGGKTPRYAMQTIGTEWGRDIIDGDLWIRAWQAAVDKLPAGVPVVVDDCRFPNEAAAIQAAGGILVNIQRPGAGTASVHASEQHTLPASRTLHNTLDERNLREQVDIRLGDLSWADQQATA